MIIQSKYTKIFKSKDLTRQKYDEWVFVTVLRELLLKQLDNGAFKPKKLKREKVKEVLLSFRRTLQETARSECTESSVTTFDYV